MPNYIIKSGDTLSRIAAQYGTTVQALAAANGISDPNKIRAGATLKIPQKSSASAMSTGFQTSTPSYTQRNLPIGTTTPTAISAPAPQTSFNNSQSSGTALSAGQYQSPAQDPRALSIGSATPSIPQYTQPKSPVYTNPGGKTPVTLGNGTTIYIDSNGIASDANGSPIGNDVIAAAVQKHVDDVVTAVVSSGKTVNPGLTPEDLAAIDPANFLTQAEAVISPSYKEKFQVVKDSLLRDFSNLGYDLNKSIEDTNRVTAENQLTGREDLAGRGLAFSGTRNKFETDTIDKQTRAVEDANVKTQRLAQEAASSAESKIGTEAVRGLNLTPFGGQSVQFGSTPLTGSIPSEQKYATLQESRYLAEQAARLRGLSFA